MADMKTVYDCPVDYTADEAREILRQADLIHKVESTGPNYFFTREVKYSKVFIKLNGELMQLSRTDLMDDVCTGHFNLFDSYEEALAYYMHKVRYGARVKRWPHGTFFAVIDSVSDG